MEKKELTLRIKLGPVEFEATGKKEDVEEERKNFISFISTYSGPLIEVKESKVDVIYDDEKQTKLESGLPEASRYGSFNNMRLKLKLTSNTDLVMGAAYYLSEYERNEAITLQDIRDLLKRTKNKTKINISQFIAQNINKGFIEENIDSDGDGKSLKTYRVLNSAEDWVRGLEEKLAA